MFSSQDAPICMCVCICMYVVLPIYQYISTIFKLFSKFSLKPNVPDFFLFLIEHNITTSNIIRHNLLSNSKEV